MARNNQKRTQAPPKTTKASPKEKETPTVSPLSFVTPTEFVALPSGGRYYDTSHPLHNQEEVEINYMTARDEDILTSQTLLKKGVALERFLENIIVNKNVNPSQLLTGDRNAILVAARITGYGAEYETQVVCPACTTKAKHTFDLTQGNVYAGDVSGEYEATPTSNNTFLVTLPLTKVTAEIRLLTGEDELFITKRVQDNKRRKILESNLTTQFEKFIVSLNGDTNQAIIKQFISQMPACDSHHLRSTYRALTPNLDLTQNFECDSCGHSQRMEVPFTTDFFWPN